MTERIKLKESKFKIVEDSGYPYLGIDVLGDRDNYEQEEKDFIISRNQILSDYEIINRLRKDKDSKLFLKYEKLWSMYCKEYEKTKKYKELVKILEEKIEVLQELQNILEEK